MTLKDERAESNAAAGLIFVLFLGLVAQMLTGCGQITGMKEMDLWGANFKFSNGSDFHVGLNSIDRVDDRRGVGRMAKKQNAELPAGGY